MRPVRIDPHGLATLRALVLAVARDGLVPGPAHEGCLAGSASYAGIALSEAGGGSLRVPAVAAGTGSGSASGSTADARSARIEALVELAQHGDGEAFAAIYDEYVDQVYRYVYFRCGDHALAEDLTSETFLRALRRLSSFTWQGRDIGAWFVTIARNLVADHYKSGRHRFELATADILDADRADDGIEDAVVEHLDNAELLRAVKGLKPEQQECIVLRFLQGLSVAETAEIMGRSEGAIKQLQLRAVRTLARTMGPVQR